MIELSMNQQFELIKMKEILKDATKEQIIDLFIDAQRLSFMRESFLKNMVESQFRNEMGAVKGS